MYEWAHRLTSLQVLANFGFLLALLFGRILQRIFFGPLQSREVEASLATRTVWGGADTVASLPAAL